MKTLIIAVLSFGFLLGGASAQTITVVNMTPGTLSGETNQDSEPDITVSPIDAETIVATAFTPNPTGSLNTAPIYISQDGGATWVLNNIVPSGNGMTGDITVSLSRNDVLYAAILRGGSGLDMRILRSANYTGAVAMTQLLGRVQEDQPYARVFSPTAGPFAGNDLLYVGHNDFNSSPDTASLEQSLDVEVAPPPAGLGVIRLERRVPFSQDGPPIRPAIHSDGTVYAVYMQRTNSVGSVRTGNVVVVRDDDWGQGPNAYSDLVDPGDLLPGLRVVTGVSWVWNSGSVFGQERLGDRATIAVDPNDSQIVYVAWADRPPAQVGNTATLHVRRSADGGNNWSADQLTVNGAIVPQLAVNSDGDVGFLYQQLTGPAGSQRWETHFRRSTDGGASWDDFVLADTPSDNPAATFLPYIGDYAGLTAMDTDFYGVFSASNIPDDANFPNGVTYQRNADFNTNTLLANDGVTPVTVSIDPFFFNFSQPSGPEIQIPGGIGLGAICVGATSTGTLNVCNTGTENLTVDSISSSDPDFSVTTPSSGFPVTISPDFCFPFQVEFTPSSAGPQAATLTVASDDPDSPNTAVQATGVGTEPDIRVTGSTDFGVPSAWRPAEKTLAVCNTGGCGLAVASAAIACGDFTLVSDPFPATLSPGACLDLVLGFTPALPGTKSCGLAITSDDPDSPVVNRVLTGRTPPLFSLHAGLVDPQGALNGVAKQGSSLTLDFLYPFQPQWAWDVSLTAASFDGQAGQPDTDLWMLSANARFTLNPAAPVRWFLNGGLGVYHFDPGDFEGGGNLGLGLNVPAGSRFSFEATYDYHSALTASPSLEFGQVQLGFLVSF